MKTPLNEQLEIFFSETTTYIFFYALYALVVSGISLLIESRSQIFEKAFPAHLALWLSAVILFTINLFIIGWRSRMFGGEFTTFVITALISHGLLYGIKRFFIHYNEVSPSPSPFAGLLPAVMLLLPFVLFSLFGFALGAAWKN